MISFPMITELPEAALRALGRPGTVPGNEAARGSRRGATSDDLP